MEKKILKRSEMDSSMDLDAQLDLDEAARSDYLRPEGKVHSEGELKDYKKGQALVTQALHEAKDIKERAKALYRQVEQKIKEAQERGYEKGHQEGLQKASELQARIILQNETLFKSIERDMLDLVYEIARKVIGDAFRAGDDAILGMIRQAMQSSLGNKLVILVNTADFERVKQRESALLSILHGSQSLQIKAVDSVPPDSCVIESELGTIEAHLDSQLEAIKKALGLEEGE